MRFVLALLAIIGLLASPVAAAAAQAACGVNSGDAMAHMAMADVPGMAQADTQKTTPPCCDPGDGQAHKTHGAADCAQACAAMCGVVAALPSGVAIYIAPSDRAAPPQARVASLKTHEPNRLERPPRPIA